MKEMVLPMLHCFRCDHEWHPRNNRLPKVCPICKRTDWNKENETTDNEFITIAEELSVLEHDLEVMDEKLERLFDKRAKFYNLRPCQKKIQNITEKLSELMHADPPVGVHGLDRNARLSIFG